MSLISIEAVCISLSLPSFSPIGQCWENLTAAHSDSCMSLWCIRSYSKSNVVDGFLTAPDALIIYIPKIPMNELRWLKSSASNADRLSRIASSSSSSQFAAKFGVSVFGAARKISILCSSPVLSQNEYPPDNPASLTIALISWIAFSNERVVSFDASIWLKFSKWSDEFEHTFFELIRDICIWCNKLIIGSLDSTCCHLTHCCT